MLNRTNSHWNDMQKPYVTIITPIYNRSKTIKRALSSVEKQSYKEFEYILVDDGSTDNIDSIIEHFILTTSIPTMYIKKSNGGVHTARNIGVKHARGFLCCFLDSDDEFVENGIQLLVNAWKEIPNGKEPEYFEVKARCIDENGMEIGKRFPVNMNEMKWDDIKIIYESISAEHCGIRKTSILKANPWPEPDGIKFVGENIIWYRLRNTYKTWVSNECVQVYHTEGSDHLAPELNTKKKSIQQCKDSFWNITYQLNQFALYGKGRSRLKAVFSRQTYLGIMKYMHQNVPNIRLKGVANKLLAAVLYFPGCCAGVIYVHKRM